MLKLRRMGQRGIKTFKHTPLNHAHALIMLNSPSPFATANKIRTFPFFCMMGRTKRCIQALFILLAAAHCPATKAQPLSGVWRGKVQIRQGMMPRSYQIELHWERMGDSLRGHAFYFQGKQRFVQTAIEGKVDPYDGTVTWTDTRIVDGTITPPGKGQLYFSADINCPGEGVFKLDGDVGSGDAPASSTGGEVHLEKVDNPLFTPSIPFTAEPTANNVPLSPRKAASPEPARQAGPTVTATIPPRWPIGIEDKFQQRKKTLVAEFPLSGDTLEIHFYDHAEIDGDSISIFLGNRLWKDHILLKATPFTIKLAIAELGAQTELTMVAENLGSIPPNTSLMIAYINGQRHEARLESTENSSAMIRFTKGDAVNRQP